MKEIYSVYVIITIIFIIVIAIFLSRNLKLLTKKSK